MRISKKLTFSILPLGINIDKYTITNLKYFLKSYILNYRILNNINMYKMLLNASNSLYI